MKKRREQGECIVLFCHSLKVPSERDSAMVGTLTVVDSNINCAYQHCSGGVDNLKDKRCIPYLTRKETFGDSRFLILNVSHCSSPARTVHLILPTSGLRVVASSLTCV